MRLLKWLSFVFLSCAAGLSSAEISSSDLQLLRSAKPGQPMQLDIARNRQSLPYLPVKVTPAADGPQFLFSDKPEYFPTNGIALLEEVKPGAVRLYVYHVPEPARDGKTITAVVKNLESRPVQLKWIRKAFPRPGGDYHRIAKEALVGFLSAKPEPGLRTIQPGGVLVLDSRMDSAVATRDQLVHGFYEFELDGRCLIAVLQRDPRHDSATALEKLSKLPARAPGEASPSGAGRGRFETANLEVTLADAPHYDTASGPMQLVVADGKRDPWITGHDSIESRPAANVGNYGVIYRIKLKRTSSDGRALALLFGKLDVVNQYCGAVAAAVQLSRGGGAQKLVPLPSTKVAISEPGEVAVIGMFEPVPAGQSEEVEILYSPPGAACLPTPLLLVPLPLQ